MNRKKKLEAGLAGLFSTSKKKKRARPQKPVATDAGAPVPEHAEAAPPEVEQPEAVSPAPEQPVAAAPTDEVNEVTTEEQSVVPTPERPVAADTSDEDEDEEEATTDKQPVVPPSQPEPPSTDLTGELVASTEPSRSEPSEQAQAPVPGTDIATNGHEEQLVIFILAREHYGVDIGAVESIIKMQPITAVPRAPSFVEGLTNLRGTVLPVIDLRRRFGLPVEEETKETRIVVVEINGMTVGMVVDGVSEVLHVPGEDIEPPSPIVSTVDSSFITGIAKVDERLIILLDLGQVLSTRERAGLQALSAGSGG